MGSVPARKKIFLKRVDTGEPVLVSLNFTLETPNKKFQVEKSAKHHCLQVSMCHFGNVELLNLENYYQETKMSIIFENDVFFLKITMKILGRLKSKIIRAVFRDK